MDLIHTLTGQLVVLQNWLTHLMIAYPFWSGGLFLLIVAAQFLPVSGQIIPGSSLLVVGGSLAAAGKVSLVPMLLGGTLGALTSLELSYRVAWHYRTTLWQWAVWRRHQAAVKQTQDFFARHGSWAVILGRFLPGVRVLVALLAGANAMPRRTFNLANLVGGVAWVVSHVAVGYYGLKIFL